MDEAPDEERDAGEDRPAGCLLGARPPGQRGHAGQRHTQHRPAHDAPDDPQHDADDRLEELGDRVLDRVGTRSAGISMHTSALPVVEEPGIVFAGKADPARLGFTGLPADQGSGRTGVEDTDRDVAGLDHDDALVGADEYRGAGAAQPRRPS